MIYAIGDIHGHRDMLAEAHRRIAEDWREFGGRGEATVVHIGDLCDRGPDTKGVIQFLLDGIAEGRKWIVLKGNHDRMFSTFLETGEVTDDRLAADLVWTDPRLGGQTTLASYTRRKGRLESDEKFRNRARAAVPDDHAGFLAGLPVWYRAEGKIFVHAGIRPGFPMDAQDEDDLLWIRDEFLWHLGEHEALIVHGHTPVEEPTHYGNRVNIDTGAGWGHELVPVAFEKNRLFALFATGRLAMKVPSISPKKVVRR